MYTFHASSPLSSSFLCLKVIKRLYKWFSKPFSDLSRQCLTLNSQTTVKLHWFLEGLDTDKNHNNQLQTQTFPFCFSCKKTTSKLLPLFSQLKIVTISVKFCMFSLALFQSHCPKNLHHDTNFTK